MSRGTTLLAWFAAQHRALPWRHTTDPYRILVSEVMLQQTQVSRVIPFYERFVLQFPDASALAAAPLHEVLQVWKGLGYPSRAKRLRDSARIVTDSGWPTSAEGLQTLPGVGPYTAAAVASIAFGERIAAIDTNVTRVVSRWMGTPLSGTALEAAANAAVTGDPGTWNQAVMELGALLCRPSSPMCGECPVAAECIDSSVYAAPPRQPRFRGSLREVRGAVLGALTEQGTVSCEHLCALTGHEPSRIASAVEGLIDDGLVRRVGAEVAIAS